MTLGDEGSRGGGSKSNVHVEDNEEEEEVNYFQSVIDQMKDQELKKQGGVEVDPEEEDRIKKLQEKQKMFEALVDLDFSGDVSVKNLLEMPYEVDGEDGNLQLTMQGFLKVLKMYFPSSLFDIGLCISWDLHIKDRITIRRI